ncbi:hypothetical protein HK099_004383 [Clydaea vesicula]|uniref:Ankyrin repeat protein n=1 Tax=Clydaea vesicula TaxID=447962 RepID=A0AAD5XZN2_9FUNG|nr:hypothetical protein HK099_004383 [Clydaea vesicula]
MAATVTESQQPYASAAVRISFIKIIENNDINGLLDAYTHNPSPADIGRSFKYICELGREDLFKIVVEKSIDVISNWDLEWGYKLASEGGFKNLTDALDPYQQRIGDHHKGWAMKLAYEKDHIDLVKDQLQKYGGQINAQTKGWLVKRAAEKGDFSFLTILSQYKEEISAHDAGWALKLSSELGFVDVVKSLLVDYNERITPHDKGWAVRFALEKNHSETAVLIHKNIGASGTNDYNQWAKKQDVLIA